jgi:hypothetical protein
LQAAQAVAFLAAVVVVQVVTEHQQEHQAVEQVPNLL